MRSVVVGGVVAAAFAAVLSAQQVGPNVNVLAGIDPRTGDAFLQRQNEPSGAVSTRNPDHLIFAFNDYRTVDLALDTTEPDAIVFARAEKKKPAKGAITTESVRAQTPPEAWIGLAFSRDRGRTFYNALLPGYPQDPSDIGKSSPIYGDAAGSDPVLITGQNGRVYLIALTFDRGGISRISSSRFTDRNSVEGGEPFYFDFTRQIDKGSMASKGRFGDKPSGAAFAGSASSGFSTSGVSKKKKQIVVVPGCERLYTAYTVFEGNESNGNFRSSIYASVSASCGESWSNPIKISAPYTANGQNYPGTRNQGTATAVDPDTGHVYISWRTYAPNGMVYVKSTDGGLTFSSPKSISPAVIHPFDQPSIKTTDGTNVVTFRSNAYPSLMVYDGKPIAVWSERYDVATGLPSATGVPRVVMTVGTPAADGSVAWSPRRPIDMKDPGVATPNMRCEQVIPDTGLPVPTTLCRPTGAQVMPYVIGRDGQITVVYYEARSDAQAPGGIAPGTGYISGIQRQLDVRAALLGPPAADPGATDISTWITTTSFQVSRYQIDPLTGRTVENPNAPFPELKKRVNYPNFPMYLGGVAPFIGDYIHAIQLRPDGSGPGYRVAFTTNEFVDPPPALSGMPDFTQYDKPQSGFASQCNPGSRNSTIVTAEVGTGLVVGSPGTFKQLVNSSGLPVQRAFAVYVENHTPAYRAFRLSFTSVAAGVQASFEQFAQVPAVDVEVLASSSVTRTVYLTGNVATGSVVVNAQELQLPDPPPDPPNPPLRAAVSLNLRASLTLNGDPTNPFVGFAGNGGNPGLENTETHTPQIESPQLGTPQLGTPQIESPQLGTPQLGTPQLGTPQLGTPQISSPQIESTGPVDPYTTDITVKVTNDGNTASAFNSLVSLANAPHLQQSGHTFQVIVYRVHQAASVKGCNIGKAQQDQVGYMTPQLGSPQLGTPQLGTPQIGTPQLGTPQLGTPQLGTPQLGTPQLGTPQLASASFSIAPADPTPDDHDGTEHEHQGNDALMLTVRVTHPPTETVVVVNGVATLAEHPNTEAEFTNAFAIAVQAQAADTGETEPTATFVDTVAPDTTILTTPPAQTLLTTAKLTFAGNDNLTPSAELSFMCSIDASPAAPCSSPINFPLLAPGLHTFSVFAIDEAGNADPTPATATWTTLAYGTADLVVADGAQLNRFSAAGTLLGAIGTLPQGACAQAFDIAPNGDYYVADACTPAVWKVTPAGAVTNVFTGAPLANPVAIAIDLPTGNLIVGDNITDTLYTVTPAGNISTLAALPGPSPTTAQDIDIRRSAFGTFVVAYDDFNDVIGSTAIIAVTSGGSVTPIVTNLTTPSSIGGLTINGSGSFIVGDFRGNRIVEITPALGVNVLRTDTALAGNLASIEGDNTRGPLFGVINGVNGGAPRLVSIDTANGVTVLNGVDLVNPNAIRFLVQPPVAPAGTTGPLDLAGTGNVNTVVGTWTQNASRDFALVVDLGQKTVSLQIDGFAVPGAQNRPFVDATAVNLSRVSMELGTIGTQRLGWDNVTVRNEDPDLTTTIFNGDFTSDALNAPPGPPLVGTWTVSSVNGSVLVQPAFGDLSIKPVVLSQFGGVNSVGLAGTVNGTAPTSGVWTVRWKSNIDPGTQGPFTAIVVRDSSGRIVAAVEYR
jgi:hypothetical protein